jgi:hypothetical protein
MKMFGFVMVFMLASGAVTAQEAASLHGTISFARRDANNTWSYDETKARLTVTHQTGLFGHAGSGVMDWHDSGYSTSRVDTYGIGYHDKTQGRLSYQQDYQQTSTTTDEFGHSTLCGSRNHTFVADYYAPQTTFSLQHFRRSSVGCGGTIDDSTVASMQWYPSDDSGLGGGVQEGENTRVFYAGAQNRWHTPHGSLELRVFLTHSPATDDFARRDWVSLSLSFRPGDNKSMLDAHRSIFDAAPVVSISHFSGNGYRNSSLSVSYSF